MEAYYAKVVSPIAIDNNPIKFVNEAEHVGILRSTFGNLPHILQRFTSHKKVLGAVLPVGLARGHRGNPAASLFIHNLYATPVLFSGAFWSDWYSRHGDTQFFSISEKLFHSEKKLFLCKNTII